ncbi:MULTISPECIES: helix-turn-helix transcriptional regulator [unclassified Nocardioides]|uniref:helix-turn-helix transcriptional regulator n=1 Tax=unclassified Nocardioides TaxID=2615069 RepID=UPI0012E3DC0C|nr:MULTISPECIES: LuxR family transcriptional regulator [unclassified Nocardioides]
MDRGALMAGVLDHLAAGTAEIAIDECVAAWEADGDPAALGLAGVAGFWRGDFADATARAAEGLAAAADDDARAVCAAALSLAATGDEFTDPGDAWTVARDLVGTAAAPGSPWWSCVRYLVAEAAMVSVRIDDTAAVHRSGPAPAAAWAGHPFAPLMVICQVREATFSGRVDDALGLLGPMMETVVPGTRVADLIGSVAALVHGFAGDDAGVEVSLPVARHVPDTPHDYIDRGALMLLAYGAMAVGDAATSAAMTFRAGADEDLSRCTIIDRALGLEILLISALEEGDDEAAAAWLVGLGRLAGHPIADTVVLRGQARHALASGDPEAAIEFAKRSVELSVAAGRQFEVADGDLLVARAQLALSEPGAASRTLRTLVAESDRTGHAAVRRSATAALAASGRRLPPIAGGGWSALSAREAEVARAILAGRGVEEIAMELHLSPGTVRTHISRVLCAFGVATRVGLLAAVGRIEGAAPPTTPALSPRQAEVAALVAAGRTNKQVAAELGIAVKSVEKHLGDIRSRWDAGSRFEVARIWWGSGTAPR